MRIIKLEATNVKKLRAVAITPAGNIIRITGANGSGKSSVLDSIFWALTGKKNFTSKPVRAGEESASIKLDLGTLIVTRKISGDGDTTLVVESVEGARFPSPQRMLDDLLGALSFDPLAFSRAEPKAQLETLRGLVTLDVDIDTLARLNERDFTLRADWNRKTKSLRERVSTLAQGVDMTIDVTPIDVTAIVDQMTAAGEHNAARDKEEIRRGQATALIARHRETADACRAEAARLTAKAGAQDKLADEIKAGELGNEPLPDPIDISELRRQYSDAQRASTERGLQLRQREAHQVAMDDLTTALNASNILTKQMVDRTADRAAAIARANMPVPGLGFGEGEVLYNDLPFDQASTAEQIRVSMAIAMAAKPKLRIVLIRDGSLLDENSLAILDQMAEENDFQIIIESVDTSGKIGIYMEEGQVAAVDGVPVEQGPEPEAASTSLPS